MAQHIYKLSFGGVLFTQEQWNCNLMVLADEVVPNDPEDFKAALESFMSGVVNDFNSQAKLDFIKFNEIAPLTGKYADPTTSHTFIIGTPVTGSGGPAAGHLAICLSIGTTNERGLASKGRIYMPAGIELCSTDANGQMPSGTASGLATGFVNLINALNTVIGLPTARIGVWSQLGQVGLPVTHVRVGRVLDTQRRRRSSLVEGYATATVT